MLYLILFVISVVVLFYNIKYRKNKKNNDDIRNKDI